MKDKLKIKVSSFVAGLLDSDAYFFGFRRNETSNRNAFLNKLIPILVSMRKERRREIEDLLEKECCKEDKEKIYRATNRVVEKAYFNGEKNGKPEVDFWIRPSKETLSVFDEIEVSEAVITGQKPAAYIRGLLNEYAVWARHIRERIAFSKELYIFEKACRTKHILCYYNKTTKKRYKAFAFGHYYKDYSEDKNHCVLYDIKRKWIKTISLKELEGAYLIREKYDPSAQLLQDLSEYLEKDDFEYFD